MTNEMQVRQLTEEIWTRVVYESAYLDQDQRYLVRGIIQSVLDDVIEAYKEIELHNDGWIEP